MRGADPGAGQHRDDNLGDHRQKNPHHVALAHAEALQTVGEQLDVPMQIRISDRPFFAFLTPPVIGDSVTETGRDMAVQAVGGNVQPAVREPRVERRVTVIEPLGEGGVPAQQRPCLIQPEAHRVAGGGVPVHLVAGDETGGRGEPLDRQETFKVLFQLRAFRVCSAVLRLRGASHARRSSPVIRRSCVQGAICHDVSS